MDKITLDLLKEGKDINEVLAMPYDFVIQLLEDGRKPEEKKSLIAAFGGTSTR